eukprot:1157490-Pelagomonas_calceolata.AAC.13
MREALACERYHACATVGSDCGSGWQHEGEGGGGPTAGRLSPRPRFALAVVVTIIIVDDDVDVVALVGEGGRWCGTARKRRGAAVGRGGGVGGGHVIRWRGRIVAAGPSGRPRAAAAAAAAAVAAAEPGMQAARVGTP